MNSSRSVLVGVCAVLMAVPQAHAWNDAGHRLVAKIAYAQLSDMERARVVDILQKHPHYSTYLAADRPPDVDPKEWTFLNAAAWSDWVRIPDNFDGNAESHWRYKFHRSKWHYINYPYKAHQTEFALGTPLPASTNILKQLDLTEGILNDTIAVDPDLAQDVDAGQNRGVRLCWLFHLIGDLHQPLHVAALVEQTRLPNGDLGGNKLAVKKYANSYPVRLHSYWDGLLGKDSGYSRLEELEESLADNADLAASELSELASHTTYEQWAQESYELAAKRSYADGELPVVLWIDENEQDQVYRNSVPVLTAVQRREAEEVARRRVVLAGHRLAKKLKEIVE